MDSALIVEDNPETREWLAGVVREAFPDATLRDVATLGGARQLLEQGEKPALALVDIGLPDGSGIDLVREYGQKGLATQCVMTTIYDDDQHLLDAFRAGADGYLLKDQPRERMVEQLAGIVRGEPPLSPTIARRILRHFAGTTPAPQPSADGGNGRALSTREEEVLSLIARGYNRNDVALALDITPNTAAGYIKNVYRKLEVSGRAEATLEAVQRGLVGRWPGGG